MLFYFESIYLTFYNIHCNLAINYISALLYNKIRNSNDTFHFQLSYQIMDMKNKYMYKCKLFEFFKWTL